MEGIVNCGLQSAMQWKEPNLEKGAAAGIYIYIYIYIYIHNSWNRLERQLKFQSYNATSPPRGQS